MNNPSPFDYWWELYKEHCPRMGRKPQCKKKFESYDIETQRKIYQEVINKLDNYEDWQEKNGNGKRKNMNMPEVYLNSQPWLDPVEKRKRLDTVRDTCNETVDPKQEVLGLRKMIEMAERYGGELGPLQAQLEKRLEAI